MRRQPKLKNLIYVYLSLSSSALPLTHMFSERDQSSHITSLLGKILAQLLINNFKEFCSCTNSLASVTISHKLCNSFQVFAIFTARQSSFNVNENAVPASH